MVGAPFKLITCKNGLAERIGKRDDEIESVNDESPNNIGGSGNDVNGNENESEFLDGKNLILLVM